MALLFRASLHGFSASSFHRRCDKRGPTLTIIKSKLGFLFGGFASISWKSQVRHTRREEIRRKEEEEVHSGKKHNKLEENDEGKSSDDMNSQKKEGIFAKDPNSFLFSLTHRSKHEIYRFVEKALFFCEKHGPVFGAGYDLCINDEGKACFANLGITYEAGGGTELRKWLGGEIVFDVEDYEVFGINIETHG